MSKKLDMPLQFMLAFGVESEKDMIARVKEKYKKRFAKYGAATQAITITIDNTGTGGHAQWYTTTG